MQVFFDSLLYFTSFGAIFTLFASIAWIVIWLLKALWLWAVEPETDASRSRQFHLNLDHLKRAGQ